MKVWMKNGQLVQGMFYKVKNIRNASRAKVHICVTLGPSLVALCLMLTGCSTIVSNPPGQNEVDAKLAVASPNENFTLKEVEKGKGFPKKDVYYYDSDERDFSIRVHSEVAQDNLQGLKLPIYYKTIYINYPGLVRSLYFDEATKILESSEYYSPNAVSWKKEDLEFLSNPIEKSLRFYDVDDIDAIVSIIAQVNEVYSQEIDYNGEEWTRENPLFRINVNWYDEEEDKIKNLLHIDIDGIVTYDEIDELIRSKYKEIKP